MNKISYLIQGNNIIIVINGDTYTVNKNTHLAYEKIIEAIRDKDYEALPDLVVPKKVLVNFGAGNLSIEDSTVLWKGEPMHNAMSVRLLEMYAEGFPIEPMVRFMENLMENPSKRSVDQLYGFLDKNKLPITEDGHFLAFKKVRNDFYDIHSGTILNTIGAVVEMERNRVDDDSGSYCSTGLHFCAESYLSHFGSSDNPVMILKINPADVVSIPADYNGAKGRCCKYVVVGQVQGNASESFTSVVDSDYSADEPENTETESGETESQSDLYDLVRLHGGKVEYTKVPKVKAQGIIGAHIRQKKAMLKMVKSSKS